MSEDERANVQEIDKIVRGCDDAKCQLGKKLHVIYTTQLCCGLGIAQHHDHRITAQEQLADESIPVDGLLGLDTLAGLGHLWAGVHDTPSHNTATCAPLSTSL